MGELPPGWATDLAIRELSGSTIDRHDEYLVVRSPENPHFHWGNCLFVLDPTATEDAARWLTLFAAEFPAADWIAIGLIAAPHVAAAWEAAGVELELDEVLTTRTLPRTTAAPPGYDIRVLASEADWEAYIAAELRENAAADRYDHTLHEQFIREKVPAQRRLSSSGAAAWFGAFADNELVANLGIVRCGRTARYQSVMTDPHHRRRGLASHLLGVAGVWAAERECGEWVIVTGATNPAGRVYRAAGFEPAAASVSAYRPPPR